jgi:hypothetical protein
MAKDETLHQLSDRIQARAVRRMGELYKTFNAQGQRSDQLKEGTLQKLTQKEVAESAGISEHQAKLRSGLVSRQPRDARLLMVFGIGRQRPPAGPKAGRTGDRAGSLR